MPARDVPDIRLPDDLRPADGRFGSGPSKVRVEAVAALAAVAPTYLGTSHRQEGVRSVVRQVRAGMRDLFTLPDGYEVVLGVGGTSAFWDAAALSLIERRSQHLVFGEFSGRFADIVRAAPHLDDPDVVETPPGTHPWPAARAGIDAYAFTHNETSTGVAMPIRRPQSDGIVLVDATSGAGALAVDPREFDAYYFAPQKTFGSDGALWLALCSPAAIERIERVAASGRWIPTFLDLAVSLENSRKDQTLNTPALATLFLLADQLAWLLDHGGLDWAAARCERSAEILYGWAEASAYATPFVAKRSERSPVTGTIDFDETVPAATLAAVLRANGIVDTEPYRKLGRNQLRIAMFPAVDPDDVATLTRAIDHVVERLA